MALFPDVLTATLTGGELSRGRHVFGLFGEGERMRPGDIATQLKSRLGRLPSKACVRHWGPRSRGAFWASRKMSTDRIVEKVS